MGIEAHFFISNVPGVPEYDINQDWAGNRCEFRRITPLEAARMLMVIRGIDADVLELMDEFKLLTAEEAEEWIMSVPEDMVHALSTASVSQIDIWAIQCSDVTKDELGWEVDEFKSVLIGLASLAKKSVMEKKKMYLWNSL